MTRVTVPGSISCFKWSNHAEARTDCRAITIKRGHNSVNKEMRTIVELPNTAVVSNLSLQNQLQQRNWKKRPIGWSHSLNEEFNWKWLRKKAHPILKMRYWEIKNPKFCSSVWLHLVGGKPLDVAREILKVFLYHSSEYLIQIRLNHLISPEPLAQTVETGVAFFMTKLTADW